VYALAQSQPPPLSEAAVVVQQPDTPSDCSNTTSPSDAALSSGSLVLRDINITSDRTYHESKGKWGIFF
jgi:hypothetical protein